MLPELCSWLPWGLLQAGIRQAAQQAYGSTWSCSCSCSRAVQQGCRC